MSIEDLAIADHTLQKTPSLQDMMKSLRRFGSVHGLTEALADDSKSSFTQFWAVLKVETSLCTGTSQDSEATAVHVPEPIITTLSADVAGASSGKIDRHDHHHDDSSQCKSAGEDPGSDSDNDAGDHDASSSHHDDDE